MSLVKIFCVVVCMLLPVSAFAAGGHDSLSCTGCHGIHDAKGNIIFAVAPNKKSINPKTKKSFAGISALCLGCHESAEKGGMGIKPVSAHKSHPYGLNSVSNKVARVPNELLRNGAFECVSCHDPHPSNPNYRYLRLKTSGGSKMDVFCGLCHPMKADPKSVVGKASFFDSMDERNFKAGAHQSSQSKALKRTKKR